MTSQYSKFAYAMNASTFTSNGAVSLVTPDPTGESSGRLSLFFKSVRGLSAPRQYRYIADSCHENVTDSFLLAFHTRDSRGGKGERDIGRRYLIWLFINHPQLFCKVINLIPEYGRWDDLLKFFPGVLDLSSIEFVRSNYVSVVSDNNRLIFLQTLQAKFVQMFGNKLKEDYENMKRGEPCSLAAKWAPTEGDSLDRDTGVFNTLAESMKISPRVLRKKYITPLRSYLKIVERFMCDREWGDIHYNKVPSCAMKRLKKSFEKHDTERFKEWRDALHKKDPTVAKVNTRQLQPHELVREMRTSGQVDGVCGAQWNIMEEECMKNGSLDNDIAVVDTSASMYYPNFLPYDVACAMGLLISKCSVGKFKNHVITFNTTPEFVVLKDAPIYDRWCQLSNISWGGSTNLQATFSLILLRCKECNLSYEDMPKRLWIISDMQFNKVEGYDSLTNFEAIDKMYTDSGYTRPQIIFWNVNGGSSDFPVSVMDNGTALISGFSPSVMKSVLTCEDGFSPYGIMRKSLDDERLDNVRIALGVDNNKKKEN